jgi:formylglycine-generating enzyme required for sulfatase activity
MLKTFGAAAVAVGILLAGVLLNAGGSAAQAQEPAAASQPARELTLDLGGGASLRLVLIPAGKFVMGSPVTEKGRSTKEAGYKIDETQHEVTISKPFYLGATHVTVDQFAAFVKDSGYQTEAEKSGFSVAAVIKDGKLELKRTPGVSWRAPSFPQKGDHPVVQVSWNDACAFCVWLTKKSGRKVGLPTEAQWEYACRAGATTVYMWGDNPDDGRGWGNCADQSLRKALPNAPNDWAFFNWDDGYVYTSPVGSFKPSAWGLYDMIGNAWQWCQDRYGDYDQGPVTDPTGPDKGAFRTLRGGSWWYNPRYCRSANRFRHMPGDRFDNFGFRVAAAP